MSEINEIKEIPRGTFPINLKFMQQYQRAEPSLMGKYKNGRYYKGHFCGGGNDNISLILCKDKIFIPSKLQSYALNWHHIYLLHPGKDRTEATIRHCLYWTNIRYAVRKEVTNYDTFHCTKTIK